MKIMTKLIGVAILTTAISAPALARDVRSSLWTYRRDRACASPRKDNLPALRPTELCDVPPQASRHLWRILELRHWRRQPGLQRNAAHLVGLDQRQRGRTRRRPLIFFSGFVPRPTSDMSANDIRFRR